MRVNVGLLVDIDGSAIYTSDCLKLKFPLCFRQLDESGKIGVTIDIAAQDVLKINGNQIRDIIHEQMKNDMTIGSTTVDLINFSFTNLEGKLFSHNTQLIVSIS